MKETSTREQALAWWNNLPDSLSYFNYSGFKKLSMKRVPQNLKKIKVNLGSGKIELDNVIVEYY